MLRLAWTSVNAELPRSGPAACKNLDRARSKSQKEVAMTATRHTLLGLATLTALVLSAASRPNAATTSRGFNLELLIDGRCAREYRSQGVSYVEALKGREYAIRVTNPLDVRVAVAISVDGLNTIDARHTSPGDGRKWVLDPHQTLVISGWQTSMSQARRFYFTSEEQSYAQRLGQAQNLGIISAVFYRERVPVVPVAVAGRESGAPSAAPAGRAAPAESMAKADGARTRDIEEYAATGIGSRTDHPVQLVHLDLEERPAGALDIRYEYRAQLVRLGVLPATPSPADPLMRREQSHGFDKGFCPDIK
jgi:hypothetical protein